MDLYQETPADTKINSDVSGTKPQKIKFLVLFGILGIFVIVAITSYFITRKSDHSAINQKASKKTPENINKPVAVAFASDFAAYEEVPVNINPKIPAYSVSPDLNGISNVNDFELSENAMSMTLNCPKMPKNYLLKTVLLSSRLIMMNFFRFMNQIGTALPRILLPLIQCFTITT